MAELLQGCGYEEQHGRTEWLAVSSNQSLYMETLEIAEDETEESDEARDSGVLCKYSGVQQKSLLVHVEYNNGQKSLIKRKTDTQWIL